MSFLDKKLGVYFIWARNTIREVLKQSWRRVFTWMGAFGAETQKPTQLISNGMWVEKLMRTMDKDQKQTLLAVQGVQHLSHDPATGQRRVSGAAGLKDSQVYPPRYGQACFDAFTNHRDAFAFGLEDSSEADSDEEIDWEAWALAAEKCQFAELGLGELAEFVPAHRLC